MNGTINVWGMEIPNELLSEQDRKYLSQLPETVPPVEWVWEEMDRVWDFYQLDNKQALDQQNVGDFYSHPIWLVNGIFTAVDPMSASQRMAIAKYLMQAGPIDIADYGGGFGEMALSICKLSWDAKVTIIEPYPSRFGMARLRSYPNVSFESGLHAESYDALIVQDVLEHVDNPTKLAYEISQAVRVGGLIIFANCFYPVIKCHVPHTFHLRHTFKFVMSQLGLNFIQNIPGAEYAQVFQRKSKLDLLAAMDAESKSKLVGYFLNGVRGTSWKLRRMYKHLQKGTRR